MRTGETVQGRVSADSIEEWTFATRDTGMVTLRATSAEFTPTLSFDSIAPGGTLGSAGWIFHSDPGQTHAFRFPTPGRTYRIRVESDSTGRGGAYTLQVLDGAPTYPVRVGEIVTGSLGGGDPFTSDGPLYNSYAHDDWTLTPAANNTLVVRMYSVEFAPRVELGTREGGTFHSIAHAERSAEQARLVAPVRAGQRYVLRVGGTSRNGLAGYGTYTLHVGTAVDTGTTMRAAGQGVYSRVSGSTTGLEEWMLRTAMSGPISLEVDSAAVAPVVRLFAVEGDMLRSVTDVQGVAHAPTRLTVEIEAGREYRVQVRGSVSGPYTLRARRGGNPDPSAACCTGTEQ